jgi:hypothetical protein
MNNLLETGISLVLIFFIFSIITYVIQELIAVNLRYRGKMLWKGIAQLMDGFTLDGRMKLVKDLPQGQSPLTDSFFNHPQIKSLQKNLLHPPSYIPASNFALAIMDLIAKEARVKQNKLFIDFQAGLQTLENNEGNLYKVLKNLVDTSSDIKELQEKIETWFNEYMNRVSGWYKSHTVVTVRIIAFALALVFNINVIKLAKTIYKDGRLRSSLVAMAEGVVNSPNGITQLYTQTFEKENAGIDSVYKKRVDSAATAPEKKLIEKERDSVMNVLAEKYTEQKINAIKAFNSQLNATGLPLGWKNDFWENDLLQGQKGFSAVQSFLLAIIGLLIGAGCISMGAPFWFDMLGKLVNVRSSGKKPAK